MAVKIKRIIIWVFAGIAILVGEVLLSYVAVTKFLMPRSVPEVAEKKDKQTAEPDSQAFATRKSREAQKVTAPVEQDTDFTKIEGIYTLSDFVINPANSNGKHFFVFTVVFAFDTKDKIDLIKKREPILKDRIIGELSKKTFEWYTFVPNKETVRQELLNIAGQVLRCRTGIQVYFTKYVLQ